MSKPRSKKFEEDVQAYLKKRVKDSPVFFHRFADTRAARGAFLPAQPGDFMLLLPGGGLLIETKTSTEHRSLKENPNQLIQPTQIGQHTLWLRSGHSAVFLFEARLGPSTFHYELWASRIMLACCANRADKRMAKPIFTGDTQSEIMGLGFGSLDNIKIVFNRAA